MDLGPNSQLKRILTLEFYSSRNKLFRQWFNKNISDTEQWKERWIQSLKDTNKLQNFVPWFLKHYIQEQEQHIAVLDEHFKQWKTTTGSSVRALYPPTSAIRIASLTGSAIEAEAFKKPSESQTEMMRELAALIKQNNYTNAHLQIVGNQLSRIEDSISKLIDKFNELAPFLKEIPVEKHIAGIKDLKNLDKVTLKPAPIVSGFKKESNISKDILDLLNKKLSEAKISTIDEEISPNLINRLNVISQYEEVMPPIPQIVSKINDTIIESDNESQEDDIPSNQIIAIEDNFLNRIKGPPKRMERYYYQRPTPADVLFEENDAYLQADYNGRNIYEWNIDGFADMQIYAMLHRMMMYATVCRQNQNTDKVIANLITCGFTGTLKGWWDNYLSQYARDEILNATKIVNNEQSEDAVYTLVLAIVQHFTGNITDQSETLHAKYDAVMLIMYTKCIPIRCYSFIILYSSFGKQILDIRPSFFWICHQLYSNTMS